MSGHLKKFYYFNIFFLSDLLRQNWTVSSWGSARDPDGEGGQDDNLHMLNFSCTCNIHFEDYESQIEVTDCMPCTLLHLFLYISLISSLRYTIKSIFLKGGFYEASINASIFHFHFHF